MLPRAVVPEASRLSGVSSGRPAETCAGEREPDLAERITRAASKQSYYTIRLLVDRCRVADAFRSYAYFRWVDDMLDEMLSAPQERLDFIERQRAILDACRNGTTPPDLTAEEALLSELIAGNARQPDGLHCYLVNMMAVMSFDARRRWHVVSQQALNDYSRWLATAVTEALHFFIGHDCPTPHNQTRYRAATAAHISHMLRDSAADIAAGYFNIPHEFLLAHDLDPCDLENEAYRQWAQSRVALARDYFSAGKRYLRQVPNLRCRLAGYAYIARFTGVLDALERDGFRLRTDYSTQTGLAAELRHGGMILFFTLDSTRSGAALRAILHSLSRSTR